MSYTKNLAVKYFKRNPNATVAHVVLDKVSEDLTKATAYQKTVYAKKVTSYLRTECAEELGEKSTPQPNETT